MAKILVLEDDDLLRDVLVKSLEDEDYEVVPTSGSLQALAEVEKDTFNLIISDVRMQGMDGIDCLARIREIHPQMRSIVITGYASEDAPLRALGVEADEYLYKPVDLDVLCTAVERVLEGVVERRKYNNFFSGLSQRLKKVMGKEPPADLEAVRERAYRNFYVACRSGILKPAQAEAVWSHFHAVEKKRLRDPEFELVDQFDHIVELIRSSALQNRRIISRDSQGPDAHAFGFFYKNLNCGSISLEKLKTAVLTFLLREKASLSPPLKKFYQEIWGSLPEAVEQT